jgi:hypothetical protein
MNQINKDKIDKLDEQIGKIAKQIESLNMELKTIPHEQMIQVASIDAIFNEAEEVEDIDVTQITEPIVEHCTHEIISIACQIKVLEEINSFLLNLIVEQANATEE